jgi:hypothetical protein
LKKLKCVASFCATTAAPLSVILCPQNCELEQQQDDW